MDSFSFSAIGTKWGISLDGDGLKENEKKAILDFVVAFEKRFSRFLPDSEVNAFRGAKPGEYEISKEFARLLLKADALRKLTDGAYDPAAGGLLERAGYDDKYSMKSSGEEEEFVLPGWSIKGEMLTLYGPTAFDLGGIGKGYAIDQVADILKKFGHKHFLVDGGGDMFATAKKDGSPWKIALEYPGKPDLAAGVIYLKNQGLAVSDTFRRRWGKWHHIVNPKLKKSIENVIGAVAVAGNAWDADCMTSVLFLSADGAYPKAAQELRTEYLVFQSDGRTNVSPNWKGKLFQ